MRIKNFKLFPRTLCWSFLLLQMLYERCFFFYPVLMGFCFEVCTERAWNSQKWKCSRNKSTKEWIKIFMLNENAFFAIPISISCKYHLLHCSDSNIKIWIYLIICSSKKLCENIKIEKAESRVKIKIDFSRSRILNFSHNVRREYVSSHAESRAELPCVKHRLF